MVGWELHAVGFFALLDVDHKLCVALRFEGRYYATELIVAPLKNTKKKSILPKVSSTDEWSGHYLLD